MLYGMFDKYSVATISLHIFLLCMCLLRWLQQFCRDRIMCRPAVSLCLAVNVAKLRRYTGQHKISMLTLSLPVLLADVIRKHRHSALLRTPVCLANADVTPKELTIPPLELAAQPQVPAASSPASQHQLSPQCHCPHRPPTAL
jgi:hypothetical protein